MSSSLFFHSSPPRAPTQFQDQQSAQFSFFTPQVHRTFATGRWPLKPCSNTSNLNLRFDMRRSSQDDVGKGAFGYGDVLGKNEDENNMSMSTTAQEQQHIQSRSIDEALEADANAMGEVSDMQQQHGQNFLQTPFLGGTSTIDSRQYLDHQSLPPIHSQTNSSPIPSTATFTFSSPINTPSTSKNLFTYQLQSQRSNPTTQLSTRITSARSSRKVDFLSRLRRTRHDERDARGLDSFERGEYLRERREWEEMMEREAAKWEVPDELMEMEAEEEELSPVEEERELEVLVEQFLSRHPDRSSRTQWHERAEDQQMDQFDEINDDDDSGYEEAFLEVLSQAQHLPQAPSDIGLADQQARSIRSGGVAMVPEEVSGDAEGVMDVS